MPVWHSVGQADGGRDICGWQIAACPHHSFAAGAFIVPHTHSQVVCVCVCETFAFSSGVVELAFERKNTKASVLANGSATEYGHQCNCKSGGVYVPRHNAKGWRR